MSRCRKFAVKPNNGFLNTLELPKQHTLHTYLITYLLIYLYVVTIYYYVNVRRYRESLETTLTLTRVNCMLS